ncbi:MBL fold metallo-hydrolase [Kouleothrix sp.]|uniref:MBL fold metallo-hydrolase n=1 Tax=Kouleothrix sp. TaxID=2779161 RepID=UPI00391CAAC9
MPLLQPITTRTFYIPGSNNLGIVATGDGGAIAVDTGLDKDAGRLIRKALDEAGLVLRAIVNTHHHADHIGGNEFLVRNIPGVQVYAPRLEAALIEHPLLEPVYLSMGARPIAPLQNKWLLAKGVAVNQIVDGSRLTIGDVAFDVVELPGHSLGQIGLAFDGVCFAADGFFGPAILQKHGIPYAQDVAAQLASLGRLAERGELLFLPGHGELTPRDRLEDLLALNQAAIERASDTVWAALAEPGDLYAVARRARAALGLALAGIPQYAIFASAVSAHLAHLHASGRARVDLADEGMIWQRA